MQVEVAGHYERMVLTTMTAVRNIPVERVACMVRDRMCGMGHELCYSANLHRLVTDVGGNPNGL